MTRTVIAVACALALGACGAQTDDEQRATTYTAKDADNTARNARDRNWDADESGDEDNVGAPAAPPDGAGTGEPTPPVAEQGDTDKHPTPTDQSNADLDLERTAEIRRRIVANDAFSLNGKNVKIVTTAGAVTLRGPVDSQAEKDEIERIAREVAGHDKVVSELEIVAPDDADDADDADDSEEPKNDTNEDTGEVR